MITMETEITYAEIRLPQGTGTSKLATGEKSTGESALFKRQFLVVVLLFGILFLFSFLTMAVMYILSTYHLHKTSAACQKLNLSFLQLQEHSEEVQSNYSKLLRCVSCRREVCEVLGSLNSLQCNICPEGWLVQNKTCYNFSEEKRTWNQSRHACESKDSYLLIINSMAEQHFITEKQKSEIFWIGLNDLEEESKFRWVDGSTLSSDIKFWIRSQPDNYRGSEHCVTIVNDYYSKDKNWNDDQCERQYLYVCEKEAEILFD